MEKWKKNAWAQNYLKWEEFSTNLFQLWVTIGNSDKKKKN